MTENWLFNAGPTGMPSALNTSTFAILGRNTPFLTGFFSPSSHWRLEGGENTPRPPGRARTPKCEPWASTFFAGPGLRGWSTLRSGGGVLGVERRAGAKQLPDDAGVLVGQRRRGRVGAAFLFERGGPAAEPIVVLRRGAQGRTRPMNQQRAQVAVAALADTAQHGLAAAGVLARDQPHKRPQRARIGELPRVAHLGHRRGGRKRSDPGDRG